MEIETLQINQEDLNTRRMLDLMSVNQTEKNVPLYVHTVNRILREMRLLQQEEGSAFNYESFKRRLEAADLTPQQRLPLSQRLEVLESFMSKPPVLSKRALKKVSAPKRGSNWKAKVGQARQMVILR